MSKFSDIVDGTVVANWSLKFGLIYTCNAGWIDLGHLNPDNVRPEIGASNLWRQLVAEGAAVIDPRCRVSSFGPVGRVAAPKPEACNADPRFRFGDGKTGYFVRYRQDHARIPGKPGREGRYVVKHGLTTEEKKSVALAIFMEVSQRFENLQSLVDLFRRQQSGFSREDLVSDLIGFYIGVGELTREQALRLCHPVSKAAAVAIWNREGPVGKQKNLNWSPDFAKSAYHENDKACVEECYLQPRRFPAAFSRIRPATKDVAFRELIG